MITILMLLNSLPCQFAIKQISTQMMIELFYSLHRPIQNIHHHLV
nr:MAG TPA: hypothetical protein [Caudoviricetes sp.]